MDWNKAGGNLYSGTAEFGKDMTIITTVLTIIISTFMIIGGIALFFKKPVYTVKTTMTMNASTPSGSDTNGNATYSNSGTVTECGGKVLTLNGAESLNYNGNESVDVYIKADKVCDDADLHMDDFKPIGIILIIIALVLIAFSLIKLFFVKKYKGVAAAAGVMDAFSFFKR